jgi:glycosyltransferase involved in cell wall biosynthesis
MSTRLSFRDFPAPPAGAEGWPWTVEAPAPSLEIAWPKLTVITPSFMQGEYLERTIRSVLLQNYPNLEYFVLDGGSTDASRTVIEKYAPCLAGWRCEKDRGQAATIAEGWACGSGDVFAWINSDDWYQAGAFAAVAPHFQKQPPAAWVAGTVEYCTVDGKVARRHPAAPVSLAETLGFRHVGYHQPGMFWSRGLLEKVGPLDGDMHLCFDLDFWARSLVAGFTLTPVDASVACFLQHSASKTSSQFEAIVAESRAIFQRYAAHLSPAEQRESAAWLRASLADYVLHMAYRALRRGFRGQALKLLLREMRTLFALRPPKLAFGALYRALITGRPPDWFLDEAANVHAH